LRRPGLAVCLYAPLAERGISTRERSLPELALQFLHREESGVKSWRPISNGGKFFVQFAGHIPHEDSRGRPVHYRSIENARKAADLLNLLARHNAQMLIAKARKANLAAEPGPAAAERRPTA